MPEKKHKYWGYRYDEDCPVNELKRNAIAILMRKKGYRTRNIEFRTTGLRYGYWSPLDCIIDINKIAPIREDDFSDSDCGDLFYYEWI